MKVLDELDCEEVSGLGAASEHVVYDIVVSMSVVLDERGGIVDDGDKCARQVKVFLRKGVHNGIKFDYGGIDSVCCEGGGGSANT